MDMRPADEGQAALEGGEAIVLPDGTEVALHPMEAEDADALLRFHHTLSAETTHLRYFTVHPELSTTELHRFTHVDHVDREALVATSAGEIIAVARFDRLADTSQAEVAFVVADSWQGRGLGAVLFQRLAARARVLGITDLVAETLGHNRRMLTLFHHTGLPITSTVSDGVVHLVLQLGEAD